jgi:hypothetical protein
VCICEDASVPALPRRRASPFSGGVQDGQYRLSAAWRLRDARVYFPLPTVRAFGWIAPPTMPSADFCVAVRSPYNNLSPESGTQHRPPEVRSAAFTARPPDLPPRSLMTVDFAISCSLVRPGRPRYPVLVHRAAALLHASFRPHLAMTPLRFANPSPPSGWIEDFHLQAVDHARHTTNDPGEKPGPFFHRTMWGVGGPSGFRCNMYEWVRGFGRDRKGRRPGPHGDLTIRIQRRSANTGSCWARIIISPEEFAGRRGCRCRGLGAGTLSGRRSLRRIGLP